MDSTLHKICFPTINRYLAHESWPLEMCVKHSLTSQNPTLLAMDFFPTLMPWGLQETIVPEGLGRWKEAKHSFPDLYDMFPLGIALQKRAGY